MLCVGVNCDSEHCESLICRGNIVRIIKLAGLICFQNVFQMVYVKADELSPEGDKYV